MRRHYSSCQIQNLLGIQMPGSFVLAATEERALPTSWVKRDTGTRGFGV
jgi:hypothetical protein